MDFLLGGHAVRRALLTYDELCLDSASGPIEVQLRFSRSEFVDLLADAYADCVGELQHDDELTGEFEPPFPGALSYPDLHEFVGQHAEAFTEFFQTYLRTDLLRILFRECSPVATHLIRSLDRIVVRRDEILWVGTVSSWHNDDQDPSADSQPRMQKCSSNSS